jgi:predicted amidophosphoribosyltransferase
MTSCQEWLYLDGLKAPVYYLCGYVPGAQQNDALSQKLIAFKSKNFEARQFWLNHFLTLCQKLFVKDHREIIIRALGHNELDVDLSTDYKNPLSNLCYHAARETNSRYVAGMIHKLKLIPPLKDLSRDERWNMVKDNFALSQIFMEGNLKTFWFVDDIITTGATARATWKALLDWYPNIDFRVIALARTVRDIDCNNISTELNPELTEDNILREKGEIYLSKSIRGLNIKFSNMDTFFI